MEVVRPLPWSTRYMCAVVTELLDLGPGKRTTVDQVADRSGVNREAVRWCLNRLQESLLADAEPNPTRRHGPSARLWALTDSGRQQADTILHGPVRGRSA